jgi:uncharacterized spore protein YtfJ
MDVQEFLGQVGDAVTVKRVFGEPYERDGVTVIPAAVVLGGGGGGGGEGWARKGGAARVEGSVSWHDRLVRMSSRRAE